MTARQMYKMIRTLPVDKAAAVVGYIQSIQMNMQEPDLTSDEEEGLRIANIELAEGKGRAFKEAMKDLW